MPHCNNCQGNIEFSMTFTGSKYLICVIYLKFFICGLIFVIIYEQVDSARKHGILLEAVQVLTDLNLSIKKAYICSDGRYFMDGENTKKITLFISNNSLVYHCECYLYI